MHPHARRVIRRHFAALLSLLLCSLILISVAQSQRDRPKAPPAPVTTPTGARQSAVSTGTVVLADYTFDHYTGSPDTMGWTSVDLTEQADTFFHIDYFTGLGGNYLALEGNQSLWCGARPSPEYVSWLSLPGYGHNWEQRFESVTFPTMGDVTVSFFARYDVEPDIDRVHVEYFSKSGLWHKLATFSDYPSSGGTIDTLAALLIDADSLNGSTRVRFRFTSDYAWDDQDGAFPTDGAVIIDSLTVSDDTGVVDYQDFESESPGDKSTQDGRWMAKPGPGFGDFAGLFDGTGVDQYLGTNYTHLWGFFNGSTDFHSCDTTSGQYAVPQSRVPDDSDVEMFIHNQARSPYIRLDEDVNGDPLRAWADTVLVEYDVFMENYLGDVANDHVYYEMSVRFVVGDSPTAWQTTRPEITPNSWVRDVFAYPIPDGATHIQVALGVADLYYFWGPSSPCHTHAPLFDNVTVRRTLPPAILVTTADSWPAPGCLAEAIYAAQASPGPDVIAFDIPGPGPHVIYEDNFRLLAGNIVIDGYTQPGSSPNTNGPGMPWNGDIRIVLESSTMAVTLLLTQKCAVRGLHVRGQSVGIQLFGDDNVVEGCIVENTGFGILVDRGTSNRIGSGAPGARNVLIGNHEGVWLVESDNTVVSNNFIISGGHLGVVVLQSDNCLIGGDSPSEANVISNNSWHGVYLDGTGYSTQIAANLIGTDVDGIQPMGNGGYGVYVDTLRTGMLRIGDIGGGGNTIAYNGADGIYIEGDYLHGLNLLSNRIFSNGGLGVDLAPDGQGSNTSVYPPELGLVTTSSGATSIPGIVDQFSTVVGATLEFFANDECDPTGYGEGKRLLGSQEVYNISSFDIILDGPAYPWETVTALVHSVLYDVTSEFSNCVVAYNTLPGLGVSVSPHDKTTVTTPVTVTFDNVATYGVTSLATGQSGPPGPGNFEVCQSTYYQLDTDVVHSGAIEVCIAYDEGCVAGSESDMAVLHYDSTTALWVDITTGVDTEANEVCGETTRFSPFVTGTYSGTGVTESILPARLALRQNYPDPFNPVTTIGYDVPAGSGKVTIVVYDVAGRRVKTLVDGVQTPGTKTVEWNGRNDGGVPVATGIYFYRMKAGEFSQTRKMLLMK